MIVLDTNVVSELIRAEPAPRVLAWVDARPARTLAITAVTAAELLSGVARLPRGRRTSLLADAVRDVLEVDFAGRVLPFDLIAAAHYADIVTLRERSGRPISAADAQIAATCRSHGSALATRDVRDFDGVGLDVVNPWT